MTKNKEETSLYHPVCSTYNIRVWSIQTILDRYS